MTQPSNEPMISKKEALKLRKKELKKQWKKKYFKQTLKLLPLRFQKNYKTYTHQKVKVRNRYIHGESGTGKTVLAGFLFLDAVRKLCETRYYSTIKAKYVSFPMLFDDMQRSMGTFEYHQITEELLNCDVLVLDEVGLRKTTDWVGETFYKIINQRYEKDLLTIVTSNYSLNELADQLNDDRIIRRIEETYEVSKKKHFKKAK